MKHESDNDDPSGSAPAPGMSLVFEQVQFLSDRFSRDLEQEKRPSIEAYLQQVPEGSRETLLRNLVLAEVNYRRSMKDDPTVDEYRSRFPSHENLIRQIFSHSMTVHARAQAERQDTSVSSDSIAPTLVFDAPPAKQLGDYLLIRELGIGGFGVVWEAEHVEQRYRVALKTLPSI